MSSGIGGLQRYVRFEGPFPKYINFRSHHFALAFVHLTWKQEVLEELDSLLLQLWKKFKFSMRDKSVLEEIQQVQGNLKTLKILKASTTWWLSHRNSTKRVIEIFEEIVDSLDVFMKNPRIQKSMMSGMHCCVIWFCSTCPLQISNNFFKFLRSWTILFSSLPSKVDRKERLRKYLENILSSWLCRQLFRCCWPAIEVISFELGKRITKAHNGKTKAKFFTKNCSPIPQRFSCRNRCSL